MKFYALMQYKLPAYSLQKILMMVKLIFILLITAFTLISMAGRAQKVSISEKDVPIDQIFKKIHKQTGYDFLYTDKLLKKISNISIDVKNASLEEVLAICFKGYPLTYTIKDKTIIITGEEQQITLKNNPIIDIKGRVIDENNKPIPGASVKVRGTNQIVVTNNNGEFEFKNLNPNAVLEITYIGYLTKIVGINNVAAIKLEPSTELLNQVVVTALGIKQEKRSLGTAITEVSGQTIAQSQRENFLNALQGRVAGVEVANTSGLPGSSSSIIIRGITSLSGNNQPLFIVDGLPIDNTTFGAEHLASNSPGSSTGISSKNLDFSNRAADINPDDIETLTVLKGPEASALYGIDAASGAIVITTKKGQAGTGRINYTNSFKFAKATRYPEIQTVYGQGVVGAPNASSFTYLGPRYPKETVLYDNIKPFFQTAFTQKHNLSFDGGTDKATYRLSTSYINENGIIDGADLKRLTVGSSTSAKINRILSADLSLNYTYQLNNQVFKGQGGALLGLLTWPTTDDAQNYLNPDGSRRPVSGNVNLADEPENPYFLTKKNINRSITNRVVTNASLTLTPFKWLSSKMQVGLDVYANDINILRHPESNFGFSKGGLIDNAIVNNKNINAQFLNTAKHDFGKFKTNLLVGASLNDSRYNTNSVTAENFEVPEFFNINNTRLGTSRPSTIYRNRYLYGAFSNLNINYDNTLYLTLTGRNDWTSTLAPQNRSFMSYSVQLAYIFSELAMFKDLKWLSFGKLRGSTGSVGKDAPPYSIYPALENQTTTGGGYGYGFTGPSPNLKAERTKSYEIGLELKLFKSRLGLDVAYYEKNSIDQIISDLRLSYATGSILQVLNGGNIRNKGIEFQFDGNPIKTRSFSWNVLANFSTTRSKLVKLPQELPEFYVSTTRLGNFNLRNGAVPGGSVTSFTGRAYLRNKNGDILINPLTGLPLRESTDFKKIGDRNPDFSVGITNSFSYKNFSLNFLLDMRKGGDIFNGTELHLTERGLSKRTLNREEPVVIKGVLRDGLENSDHPTVNTRQIVPYFNVDYYSITAGTANEEDFIERDINWIRLKDITLNYQFDSKILGKTKVFRTASIFLTATDLFLITNYTGLDPVVNGNNASIGGSGSVGFDYGNFAFPVGINIGIKLGL